MAKTIGRRSNTGVGLETTPGITGAVKVWLPTLSNDLSERFTPIGDMSARGTRDEQSPESVAGKKWGEGSIEVILDAQVAPYLMFLGMGGYASSSSGIYIHTFSRKAANNPQTATVYRDRDIDIVKFPYSVVNTFEINFADDVAKLTAGLLSRFPIDEDAETPSYADLDLFTWRQARVQVTTNAGATSDLKVREFTLNVNNNAEMVYAPNSNDVDAIAAKQFGVDGTIVVDFENETQKDYFTGLTKVKLDVELLSGTHKITFMMPRVRFDEDSISTPNDDIAQETIRFVAETDGTDALTIEVRNDTLEAYDT